MKNILFGILTITLFSLISCSDDKESPTAPDPIVYEEASITTYNYLAAPFDIDWLVGDSAFVEDQSFAFGNGESLKWVAGNSNLSISIANATTKDELNSSNFNFKNEASYTSFAVGKEVSSDFVIFEDDDTLPSMGMVRVRFFHGYPEAGAVDIYLGGTAASNLKVTNLAYKEISNYLDVSNQALKDTVVFTPTGVLPNPDTNIITHGNNDFHEVNKIYTDAMAPASTTSQAGPRISVLNQ